MSIVKVKSKQRKILNQLKQISNFIRGKVIVAYRKCGKTYCWCYKEKKGHPYDCLTFTNKGKSQIITLKKYQIPTVEKWTKEHVKVRILIESLTEVNLKILKWEKNGKIKKGTRSDKTKK